MRLLTAISIAFIVLVALPCTATPTPTPGVPLLDEETVNELVLGYVSDTYTVLGGQKSVWISRSLMG